MASEFIAHAAYNNVIHFLERNLDNQHFSIVVKQINAFFPSWKDAWKLIYSWLQEHPLTNMQKSIHSFAQLFPNYPSFATALDDSLALHDEFWNQVHRQLCAAKSQL